MFGNQNEGKTIEISRKIKNEHNFDSQSEESLNVHPLDISDDNASQISRDDISMFHIGEGSQSKRQRDINKSRRNLIQRRFNQDRITKRTP